MSKLELMRLALLQKKIFAECHFVTAGDHTSLVESGKALGIDVYDLKSFSAKYIGSDLYVRQREKAPFGSAVHPDTGIVDDSNYAQIKYIDKHGVKYSVSDVSEALRDGRKVVLLGEFGTGKSRCLMEVFKKLATAETSFAPISINLRDNWGYRKLHHIMANHFEGLGLSSFTDNVVRSLQRNNHILLLDGFDEIGSQSWSGDAKRLTETRKRSLEGVRDIISTCTTSGILITGREHYFATNSEMVECLGLSLSTTLVLNCPDEFTEAEMMDYIRSNTTLTKVPEWMPRKPLICQLLAKLPATEVDALQTGANGETMFFENVFDTICLRETKINPSIVKETLKDILLFLAQKTREFSVDQERISTEEINQAFYEVTGYSPIDESAILLQRLPYLGRIGSGGSDRIFIDSYAKDGLRGLAIVNACQRVDKRVSSARWQQPLAELGSKIMAQAINPGGAVEKFVKLCIIHGNEQVACDYVTARLISAESVIDFQNLAVSDGRFYLLPFIDVEVKNLNISGVEISKLTIEAARFINVTIQDSTVDFCKGVGSIDKLPDVFTTVEVGIFDNASSTSRISELDITDAQKTLLAILKKLFFQSGVARREDSLLRGADKYWNPAAASEVIRYLESNKIIRRDRGEAGWLLVPHRKYTKRIADIIELQSSCGDELWKLVAVMRA